MKQQDTEIAATLELPHQNFKGELAQFTGSEHFYKWSSLFRRDLLTDGAQYVAEKLGAFWLMDLIASHQHARNLRSEGFQVWTLVIHPDGSAVVQCDDGNDNILAVQKIPHTDFPFVVGGDGFTLWCEGPNQLGGRTILLPSEH